MKKRIFAGILMICFVVGLVSGCGTTKLNGTDTVVTVGDEKATLSSLMAMVRYQQAVTGDYYDSMYAQYEAQGMQLSMDDRWDSKAEISDEKDADVSGMKVKTSGDQLVDSVATTLSSYVVVCQHADEYGVSLTDDEKAKIDVAAENFLKNSDKDAIESDGITEDGVKAYLQWYTLYDKIYDKYKEQSDIEISEKESRNIGVSYLSFSIDAESETYNTNAVVKKQAEQILNTFSGKDDLSELNFQDFAGQYSNVYASTDSIPVEKDVTEGAILSAEDVEAISKLKDGQLYEKLLAGSNGTYYIYRVDKSTDKDASVQYANELRDEKISDAFYEMMKDWKKDVKIEYNLALLDKIAVIDKVVYTGVKDEPTDEGAASGDAVQSNGVKVEPVEDIE